jgi:putative endopeptidase
MRDPEKTFNKMSVAELQSKCSPSFDWNEYFTVLGKPVDLLGEVNVATVDAVVKVSTLLSSASANTRNSYFLFHAVNSLAAHLPAAFAEAQFEFFEKELKGTSELRPRYVHNGNL